MKNFLSYVGGRLKNPAILILHVLYVAFLAFSCVWFPLRGHAPYALLAGAFILVSPLIFLVEYTFRITCGALFTVLVLFLAGGGVAGGGYNLYTIIPIFDSILHTTSGVIVTLLGTALATLVLYRNGDRGDSRNKRFFSTLVFGVFFSLGVALLWEMLEYAGTTLFGFDMQEDSIVTTIRSYLLSGTHSAPTEIPDIYETVIYYGDGQTYVIHGGYMDIGLYDTLDDMLVCLFGTAVSSVVLTANHFLHGRADKLLVPQMRNMPSEK